MIEDILRKGGYPLPYLEGRDQQQSASASAIISTGSRRESADGVDEIKDSSSSSNSVDAADAAKRKLIKVIMIDVSGYYNSLITAKRGYGTSSTYQITVSLTSLSFLYSLICFL